MRFRHQFRPQKINSRFWKLGIIKTRISVLQKMEHI